MPRSRPGTLKGLPAGGDSSRTRNQTGASLLENVMVLALIGMALTVITPSIRQALGREEIDGWARALTYDIAAGRQAALTRRTTVTVAFNSATYTIGVLSGGTLRQATLPSDITVSTSCPAGACTFDRRGVPVAAGTVTLTSGSTARSYTITIEPGTGRVSYREL